MLDAKNRQGFGVPGSLVSNAPVDVATATNISHIGLQSIDGYSTCEVVETS